MSSALLELGSSGIRFLVITGSHEIVLDHKSKCLFQAAIVNDVLSQEVQEYALTLIDQMRTTSTPIIRAVATAWARHASNAPLFLQRLSKHIGVEVRILTKEEEGQMAFNALTQDPLLQREEVVAWDIGAGSMQLSWCEDTVVVHGIPWGSVTFTDYVWKVLNKDDYPLSQEEVDFVIDAAQQEGLNLARAHPNKIASRREAVYGLGHVHGNVHSYISRLIPLAEKTSYTRAQLKELVYSLTDLSRESIALRLGIPVTEARNRLTSMILILGFMCASDIERVQVRSVHSLLGLL